MSMCKYLSFKFRQIVAEKLSIENNCFDCGRLKYNPTILKLIKKKGKYENNNNRN